MIYNFVNYRKHYSNLDRIKKIHSKEKEEIILEAIK